MKPTILTLLLLLLAMNSPLLSQENSSDPVFSTFEGVVYKLPLKRTMKGHGFGNDVLRLPAIDTIYWEEINFPDTETTTPFPGVDLTQSFGIIFTGTVTIPKTGYYQFATNSDDGTILWIDGKKIVDNDKSHKMTLRVDSVALQKGTYPLKLWYYQAFPTRYGVQLEGRFYRDLNEEEEALEKSVLPKETIVLNQQHLLFAHNSSDLLPVAKSIIDQLLATFDGRTVKHIKITGHTDNVGLSNYNQQLSLARAQAVKVVLSDYFGEDDIVYEVVGKGETEPITANDSESGRAQNRRVEIEVRYDF